MRFDVVIVGAGIGGAVLALDLGRRGWRVALVERESAPPRIARPEILWGATPHALECYGIAEAIRHTASVQLEAIDIGGEKPWIKITRDDFAAVGVDAFSTNPSMTRTIITSAATATGNVEIHRGVTVEELQYDDGRVIGVRARRGDAPLAFEASLVVGDDGGSSVVRTQLGIPITLDVFPIEFVTAMIGRWPLPPHRVRIWIHPKASSDGIPAAGFIPWPENEGVLLVPLTADRAKRLFEQPPEIFWSALERVTPMAGALREQLEFPRDFKRVARPFGHAASYVADGAALIGDAAHPMTPAGGQGANASIWDALALADVADAALRTGDVSRERLLPYERLRRPVNDESISFSRVARRAFRFGGFLPLSLVLPAVARTIDILGWPKRRIMGSFATTFVHPRA
ncbi:MAG TPA: NAD(P)/FAD-dependent oxidoreductase [Thermoanaerobaculia bacterium]|jgi:2-polyprenyl-6-methoxyphenol hydroxylase-like FAD-dependent oxidoreductase|nr:NAD(P)/FAD-dependent oxidoreductase [Thermoanaerobaculia bacterium]